jgi:Tol biopolymer transport system component
LAAENGNGIFDNGDVAQLFFGSDRLGPAGSADIYTSTRQADGSWGPASLVPELSSPGTDNRPNLRADGLEIFFYSDRTGSVGGAHIWISTRPDVTAPWSAPVNLGATVNSTAADIHPSLSADGRTLIFASARLGGEGTDLYMTMREQIVPTTKDQCKDGGWERFGIFKNQGDCVSYVATDGENQPG